MIATKSTIKWFVRLLVVFLGIGVTVVLWFSSQDTRTVTEKFFENETVIKTQIAAMRPRNQQECLHDFYRFLDLKDKYQNVFFMSDNDFIRQLTMVYYHPLDSRHQSKGTWVYKSWATQEFQNELAFRNEEWYQLGPGRNSDVTGWRQPCLLAYEAVSNPEHRFVKKAVAFLAAGIGFTGAGMFFLPLVIGFILLLLMLLGRNPTVQPVPDNNPVIYTAPTGGDVIHQWSNSGGSSAAHHGGSGAVAVQAVATWLVVLVMIAIVLICDVRRQIRTLRTLCSRAPPFHRKEHAVLRVLSFVVLIALVVLIVPAHAGQSVDMKFGEWAAYRGAGIDWAVDTGHWTHFPFATLSGAAYEDESMYHFSSFGYTVSPAVAVGAVNDEFGVTPYAGMELEVRRSVGNGSYAVDYSNRFTRLTRFYDLVLVTANHDWGSVNTGVAYQPILINGSWDHRLGLNLSHLFPKFRLGLECRSSLAAPYRKSAHVSVSVPLK